jgi:hypothetical protein
MISEELMSQVQRYMKTRSFALNENLKEELAVWLKAYKGNSQQEMRYMPSQCNA